MNQTAASFLTRCFAPDETIALLLRGKNDAGATQRIIAMERVLTPRYLAWLAYQNAAGSNIYIAANPLHPCSRRRTKESVASVRHLYIDIDSDGDARLAGLRASSAVPPPTAVLSTSSRKYQVLWRVDGFDFATQEQTLRLLALHFGGDPACTDCNRVVRFPGFLNRKYDPAHLVTVEYPDDSVFTPDDFRLSGSALDTTRLIAASRSWKQPGKRSNSEGDWAWVSDQLTRGKDPAELTQELASRRYDKPNPIYYAQRTVDMASARLSFIKGIRLDEVIAMLESRRRFEIPVELCLARAREIATTAERMIARRKSA